MQAQEAHSPGRHAGLDQVTLLRPPSGFADREENEHPRLFEISGSQFVHALGHATTKTVDRRDLPAGPGGRSERLVHAGQLERPSRWPIWCDVAYINEVAQRMFFGAAPIAVAAGYVVMMAPRRRRGGGRR